MKRFPEETLKVHEWLLLLPDFFQCVHSYAAGDIVLILTRLKKHGSELKFFVLIFRKLDQINI